MNNSFKKKLQFYCLITAISILILLKSLHLYKLWITPCHFSVWGDALPAAEDLILSPSAKSIFFHETSCRGGLTVRQACTVEAAALSHPLRQVYVLFIGPVTAYTLKTTCLAKLLQYPNVQFLRLHLAEYSKETIVQPILFDILKESKYPIQHLADVLRILTLNKFGGIYLDTDMIVTRSLEELSPNFIAKETYEDVASGILAFAKDDVGTNVTDEVLKEIVEAYDPEQWAIFGADAINIVLSKRCPKVMQSPNYTKKPINDCNGVTVFDFELFYPHFYSDIPDIFHPPDEEFDLHRPYTYHMWSYISQNETIYKSTVYEVIARTFCPVIYNAYPEEFVQKGNFTKKP